MHLSGAAAAVRLLAITYTYESVEFILPVDLTAESELTAVQGSSLNYEELSGG